MNITFHFINTVLANSRLLTPTNSLKRYAIRVSFFGGVTYIINYVYIHLPQTTVKQHPLQDERYILDEVHAHVSRSFVCENSVRGLAHTAEQ